MHQSKVLSYYSNHNEQCNCASHKPCCENSLERLTKPIIDVSCTPWHQRWLAPHFSAIPGWSHWVEVAVPRGKLYPLTAASMSAHWGPGQGVAPADTTASVAGGWLVQLVGTPVFPWLSYHSVLLLTPVLCHLRGPQITCCLVPLSPLHTNSSTLFLSLALSLGPPDTHSCLLPQGTVL